MERPINFKNLVKRTSWKIIRQFVLSLVVAYIFPLLIISFDIGSNSKEIGKELFNVFFNVFSWIYICISLLVIVSINIIKLLNKIKQEMDIVYHSSMLLVPNNSSSNLTLYEFIETNKRIEKMQNDINKMIQAEKDKRDDVLFKVSTMAHDLKTPLTVIKGNAELLKLGKLSKIEEQCLHDIEKAGIRLENYFNQLISYSKTFYDDNISLIEYELSNIESIIQQECSYLIGETIKYTYKSKLYDYRNAYINIDLDLVIRSITNIINNAIEHADTFEKKIVVSSKIDKIYLSLSIWNNGSEFSNNILNNFGKLFYRENTSRENPSEHFGIGLAFVVQVMRLHGGKIILLNHNDGAQVDLKFPLVYSENIG
ncbi:MAG: HAMP domain-containing sensor histidine kinase [Streptococcus sp.]|nr:HAMP domain-containing sensor histidine kinase [Streptococcus sp.]